MSTLNLNLTAEEEKRGDLIEKCIEYGLPVLGNEDISSLERYIEYAETMEQDDITYEELFEDYQPREEKKTSNNYGLFIKLFSFLH